MAIRDEIMTVEVNAFVKPLRKKNNVQFTILSSIILTEQSHLDQNIFYVHNGQTNVLQ